LADETEGVLKLQTLITAQWDAGNTDSITPNFTVEGESSPRMDYATTNTHIHIWPVSHTTVPYGLGASHKEATVDRISLDIRTKVSRAHMVKCYNELRRIFSSRINNPFGDQTFLQLMPLGYQSFVSQGFFRRVYDVHLKNWTVTR